MREIGKEDDGLYLLLNKITQGQVQQAYVVKARGDDQLQISGQEMELWHQRLGHMSSHILNKLIFVSIDSMNTSLNKCTVCPVAKQTRATFLVSSIKSSTCFDLVHLDIWGPYKIFTFDGNKYFLTVVDDYIRMNWLFLLKNKADVYVCLKYFLQFVHTQFGKSIRQVRFDDGTEFEFFVW